MLLRDDDKLHISWPPNFWPGKTSESFKIEASEAKRQQIQNQVQGVPGRHLENSFAVTA